MKNTFSSWSDKIARNVYSAFVRPHLELALSVWNPHLEYDSTTLESVQPRATITKETHRLPYEKKTRKIRFHRPRGDFIQIC